MSYDQRDIDNYNKLNAQGGQVGTNLGFKHGKARATFTATGGKAIGAYSLLDAGGNVLTIPGGSEITRVVYKVLTSFESGTDAATIALSVVAANDVTTATALSTGTVWDATTPVLGTPVTATAATWLHVPAGAGLPVVATVAVEALLSGKLVVFLEWMYWGDLTLT